MCVCVCTRLFSTTNSLGLINVNCCFLCLRTHLLTQMTSWIQWDLVSNSVNYMFCGLFSQIIWRWFPCYKNNNKKEQTIINRFVAHPFSVCLQIVNAFECICMPYINLYLYLQLYWSLYTLMSEQICAVFFLVCTWCSRCAKEFVTCFALAAHCAIANCELL